MDPSEHMYILKAADDAIMWKLRVWPCLTFKGKVLQNGDKHFKVITQKTEF